MNKKILILIIVAIVLIVAGVAVYMFCAKCKTYSVGEKITLSKNASAKVDELKITLKDIADSRCKEGTQCIWQGEISYLLEINGKEYTLSTVKTENIIVDGYTVNLLNESNENSISFVVNK